MIKAKAYRYPVSAMCRVIQVNRSTYYYETRQERDESARASDTTDIFKASRNNHGTRKIKKGLQKKGEQVSRRRIRRIMRQENLVSNHTTTQFRPQKDKCNEARVKISWTASSMGRDTAMW